MQTKKELVLVLDFGKQSNQLIARRIRSCDVYCEVYPHDISFEKIKELNPVGIVFTGGPSNIYTADAPVCDKRILEMDIPVLGICYGAHVIAHLLGGTIATADGEYSEAQVEFSGDSVLYEGIQAPASFYLSKSDCVRTLPKGFTLTASCKHGCIAAMENTKENIYAVQFHPDKSDVANMTAIIRNFLYKVCGCSGSWKLSSLVVHRIQEIKEKVGDKKVLCALSGGVDSSVAALMVHKAVGNNLTCIFVDTGLMRKNEGDNVMKLYAERFNINVIRVDAEKRFLDKLSGVSEPEKKRKIIGEEFIRVFEDEAKKLGKVDFLVQGTIYPDIIESGNDPSNVIKTHHNAGGLPDIIDFDEIIEPLADLFKDEVRQAGRELNMPDEIVSRQPFPGPGLSVRVIGEVTKPKLDILREADAIIREEVAASDYKDKVSQCFAIFTGLQSVGIKHEKRSYDYVIALRAVSTQDFMTAQWVHLPYELIEKISARITTEVEGVNRVVYDVTSKPPGTIEWE